MLSYPAQSALVHAGAASKGLYRVHQFSKVELFVLSTPQQSEALLEELCSLEKEMFTQLGLHFKIQARVSTWFRALSKTDFLQVYSPCAADAVCWDPAGHAHR